MFSIHFGSPVKSEENKDVKKRYANIREFMAANGIDPSITKEELEKIVKLSDGMWQQLCENSGLDSMPSSNDSNNIRKRKFCQPCNDEKDHSECEIDIKKFMPNDCSTQSYKRYANDLSVEGKNLTFSSKASTSLGSINVTQNTDFMALAATANTTSIPTNVATPMDTSEATDNMSLLPSINMLQNSTFNQLCDQNNSSNLLESMDFSLAKDITDTGEKTLKLRNTTILSESNQSIASLNNSTIHSTKLHKDFNDIAEISYNEQKSRRHGRTLDGTCKSNSSSVNEISSTRIRRGVLTRDIDKSSNMSIGEDESLLQTEVPSIGISRNQDFIDIADTTISFDNKTFLFKSKNDEQINDTKKSPNIFVEEESLLQTDIPSVKLSHNQDFMDIADATISFDSKTSSVKSKRNKQSKGTKSSLNMSIVEEESLLQTDVPSIRLSHNQDFMDIADATISFDSKTSSVKSKRNKQIKGKKSSLNMSIVEEESLLQTDIPSVRLTHNQDFMDLAETTNISNKRKWHGRTSGSTYESSATERYETSSASKSSFNSTAYAVPKGPIVPRNNFDVADFETSQTTPSLKRRSLRSISSNGSMDTRSLPQRIQAKRNLDISRFSNNDPVIAFKNIQKQRKTKIVVNEEVDEKNAFKDTDNSMLKIKEHSRSALSSQSLLSSHGTEEEVSKEKLVRRSARIQNRNIVNINNSIFQTATPAIRKVTKRGTSNLTGKVNNTTVESRSSSPESIMSEGYSEFPILIDESVANEKHTSQKASKHAIIRRKKPEKKVLIVRKPKIIKPNEDQIQFLNLRRSRRNRIPTLDHSLLQKPIYERGKDGSLTLVGVSEPVVNDPLFVKYGTADFDKIYDIRSMQNRLKRQKKETKKQNLAYYGIKSKI